MMLAPSLRKHSAKILSRNFGSLPIRISEEVKQALNDKTPIVSLESTIITHGLPHPENFFMAKEIEELIRSNGCTPATAAFIDGVPSVGLSLKELEYLATAKNVHKTSRRDIPYVMSEKLNGGTTISSTMILSKLAGIKVFATGGLGGVHKHGELTMDISADLDELSKTEVAVVCSGPKAILDIDRTIEYLETKGVPVTTFNPKQKQNVFIPGFYCEESTTPSPFSFSEFSQPAKMIYNGSRMGLGNGYLICIPPPDHLALDKDFIYKVIDEAQAEAERLGVKGKHVTPFLLGKINAETDGKSVRSNIGFVLNNAKCASEIAKQLNSLENEGNRPVSFQPSSKILKKPKIDGREEAEKVNNQCKSLIVGSVAVDSTCILKPGFKINDSNPGNSKQSIGGVGYNVTLSSNFSSSNIDNSEKSRLISIIGKDSLGDLVLKDLASKDIDNTGLLRSDANTAQYISIHADDGSLIVACADMDIIETLPQDYVLKQLKRAKPEFVLMDSNISTDIMNTIIEQSQQDDFKIVLEPTSAIKASKISKTRLEAWPNNQVILASPTCEELNTMYEGFENNQKFEDLDGWFNILDRLGLDTVFRNELDALSNKNTFVKKLLNEGLFQKAFKILPYIPSLITKHGKDGIVIIQIVTNANELTRTVLNRSKADFSLVTKNGKEYNDGSNTPCKLGILIQHYKIPQEIKAEDIKNVTGAGDSMIGYLYRKLSNGADFLSNIDSSRDLALINSQTAAGLSLKSANAVNIKEIANIQ